jgi:ComF family protein
VAEVLPQLSIFKKAALNLFFPQYCLGCGKEGEVLCRDCISAFYPLISPICPKCGKPQPGGILCSKCVNWRNYIDGIRSPFKFEGVLRDAIHQFKYKNIRCLAGPLSKLLFNYFQDNPILAEVIIPVPLHSRRLRERGYNQSALLATELSKVCGLPDDHDCLRRHIYLIPQVQTHSLDERRRNVDRAFVCLSSKLKYKNILLLDDVSTSGSTLDACAQALKTAGASSVWGLTLAREI